MKVKKSSTNYLLGFGFGIAIDNKLWKIKNLPMSVVPGSVSTVVVTITVWITVITSAVPFVCVLISVYLIIGGNFFFLNS